MQNFDELKKWAWERANMMIRTGQPEIVKTMNEIANLTQSNGDSMIFKECLLQTIIAYLKYIRNDCTKAECEELMLKAKERYNEYEFKRAS